MTSTSATSADWSYKFRRSFSSNAKVWSEIRKSTNDQCTNTSTLLTGRKQACVCQINTSGANNNLPLSPGRNVSLTFKSLQSTRPAVLTICTAVKCVLGVKVVQTLAYFPALPPKLTPISTRMRSTKRQRWLEKFAIETHLVSPGTVNTFSCVVARVFKLDVWTDILSGFIFNLLDEL